MDANLRRALHKLSRDNSIRRYRALVAGALLALLVSIPHLIVAAETPDNADALGAAAPAAPLVVASAGCHKAGARTGVMNLTTTDGAHVTRTFLVQVPADYQASRAYPLIFVYHGAGGNSSQSYSWGLQNAFNASENGIFVFPDGRAYGRFGIGWDGANNGYDIPFFDNMVNALKNSHCIDSARIFTAGFSWGGDFVTALVCNRGHVIRAAAINSAADVYSDDSNYLTFHDFPCPSTTHPAIRFEHAKGSDAAYPAPLFATTSTLYRHFDSCSATSTKTYSSTSVMSCVAYEHCTKKYLECAFADDIGHNLPPKWADDTWAFFSTFK